MHAAKYRIVVVLALAGALVTLIAGSLFRDDLALQYYHYRLRLQPTFLADLAAEADSDLARRAVNRFLDDRRGREALFQAYVTHLAEEIDHAESDPATVFTTFGGQRVWFDASYSGRKLQAHESFCERHHLVAAIRQLVPRLEGEVFQVHGAQAFEFSILSSVRAVELYRQSIPDAEAGSIFTFRGSDKYVCRVRKRTSEGD